MDKVKYSYISLAFFSSFLMGIIIYSVSWPERDIASVSYEPDNGKLCAESLKNIQIDSQWRTNKAVSSSIEDAFIKCLSGYIQLKTISPKGDEQIAVDFLQTVFNELEIPNKAFYVEDKTGLSDQRVNLIATLPKDRARSYNWAESKDNKSIILLNHMDVVNAISEQWEEPWLTWSGAVKNSYKEPDELFIWGRGALDMKGIAITQLVNMWILKQLDTKLEKDIHFLAVADEEQSGSGAIGTLKEMRQGGSLYALNNASIILNEGGGGMRNTPSDKWNLFLLAVEEKGGAWMEFENLDPISLMQNLYKSRVLNLKNYIPKKAVKIKGHDCKILNIETPQSKVNVVASKVIANFECREGFQVGTVFDSAFSKGFKTVKVNTTQTDRIVHLVVETDSSSHGSIGVNESAIDAFAMGLFHLDLIDFKRRISMPSYLKPYQTNATKILVKTLGKSNFLLKVIKNFTFIPAIRKLVLQTIEGEFGIDGLFSTTCQFSALNYAEKAKALVDCRLLHSAIKNKNSQTHAEDFKEELLKYIKDKNLSISLIDGWNTSQSTVKSKDYKTIVKALKDSQKFDPENKKVMSIPYLFPAGTDSTWFRNPWSAGVYDVKPIPSYGFFPVYITAELLGSFHGSNERFPIKEINGTVQRYFSVLKTLAKEK